MSAFTPRTVTYSTVVAVLICLTAAVSVSARIIIIGPKTPTAKSTPGMSLKFSPDEITAGSTADGVASGFTSGEYVAIWQYRKLNGKNFSSQLNGGTASAKGKLEISVDTAAGISKGKRKVCAQGLRTKRVACGSYKIKEDDSSESGDTQNGDSNYTPPTSDNDYQSPTVGPGYVPPASS